MKTQIEKLMELKQLYGAGILSKEEMEAEKAKILTSDNSKPKQEVSSTKTPEPKPSIKEEKESIDKEESFFSKYKYPIIVLVALFAGIMTYLLMLNSNGNEDIIEMDGAPAGTVPKVAAETFDELIDRTGWHTTEYGFKVPNIMEESPEIGVEDMGCFLYKWKYGDVCLCYWPGLGTWALDDEDFPKKGKYITEDVVISCVTYRNSKSTIFSGYANDGRIWYMKRVPVCGAAVCHAYILVLLYPEPLKSEMSTLINVVKNWNPDDSNKNTTINNYDSEEYLRLGECYEKGDGVEIDYETALYYYSKAAETGDPAALNKLGNMYAQGKGCNKDIYKAAKHYQAAAEKGNKFAQHNVAWCYWDGIGVEKDRETAIMWMSRSAEQGYQAAQNALRTMGVK